MDEMEAVVKYVLLCRVKVTLSSEPMMKMLNHDTVVCGSEEKDTWIVGIYPSRFKTVIFVDQFFIKY